MRTSGKIQAGWVVFAVLGVFALGCSSSKETTRIAGVQGESCQVHDDCTSGLVCVHQVCVSNAGAQNNKSDGGAQASSASLGVRGESCASRADCATGLECRNNVCADPTQRQADAGALMVVGKRGETCRTRADCEGDLACIGGTCTLADFGLAPSAKKCVLVQCQVAKDCCPVPSQSCSFYKDFCAQGQTTYCDLYDQNCVCDETQWACTENKCAFTPKCSSGTLSCPSGLICAGTKCVQCAADTDCLTVSGTAGATCKDNKCVSKCVKDGDCPYFNTCQAGACVKTGCKTDRECIASSGNVLSLCDKASGDCQVPCETDLECDSPTRFAFKSCIQGYCKDLGCETSEECRIALKDAPGGTQDAVCQ
jgi:hypothetical protein